MVVWSHRKMILLLGGVLVVVIIAISLFLYSCEDSRPGNDKTKGVLAREQNLLRKQVDHATTSPVVQPTLIVRPPVVPPGPELDRFTAEVRDDLYGQLEGPKASAALEEFISTEERVDTTVNAHLSDRNGTINLRTWVQKASEQEKALILASLIRRFDSDPDPRIRRACLVSLTMFPQRAPEVLARALRSDADRGVRRLAAYALGQRGTEKEVDLLFQAARDDEGTTSNGRDIANVAISSLGEIGGAHAAKALHDIWYNEKMSQGCREVTLVALGTAGDPSVLYILEQVLQGEDELLRDNAAFGLGHMGNRNRRDPQVTNRVIASLLTYLEDRNPKVRMSCAYALGWLGDSSHIRLLERLLEDDYKTVVSYLQDGEVTEKEVFRVRDKAREAIDRITARVASEEAQQ